MSTSAVTGKTEVHIIYNNLFSFDCFIVVFEARLASCCRSDAGRQQ